MPQFTRIYLRDAIEPALRRLASPKLLSAQLSTSSPASVAILADFAIAPRFTEKLRKEGNSAIVAYLQEGESWSDEADEGKLRSASCVSRLKTPWQL